MRVGIGTDVHRLSADVPMHCAGLHFPAEPKGLAGQSDGDVAAHAACDALLSAAGLGDLGSNFGTSDPAWAGASGVALLEETARRLREAGFDIGGRLIRLDMDGTVTYISPSTRQIAETLSLPLAVGRRADAALLRQVTDKMARLLAQSLGRIPQIFQAVGADGLHDVRSHKAQRRILYLTKWSVHLRSSFH